MLQVVIVADVGEEDVYQNVCIVHDHPLCVFQTHNMSRTLAKLLAREIANRLGDGLHLRGRIALADDKVVADGSVDAAEVGNHDAPTLFLLNPFDNVSTKSFVCSIYIINM